MPDPLVHYSVSLLISSRVYSVRKSILVALIGNLPDIDVLFGIHRSYTHTLLIPATLFLLGALARYRGYGKVSKFLYVAATLYLTHIVLDMFTGLGPYFWPISNLGIYINVSLAAKWIVSSGLVFIPRVHVVVAPYSPCVCRVFRGLLFNSMSLIIFLSALTVLAVEQAARRRLRSLEQRR